ncbi:MAG: cobyrinic acid a,c-diamide synthase [Haloferacaceae archaeon]
MNGIVLAGTASGVGKTVATLAVTRALSRAGVDVQPAKAGPDFIDPSHHAVEAGRPSRTLDPWLEGEAGMRRTYWRGEGDLCVVEGMMGLYDGDTSTAAVAAALDLPVVLVVDASAGMESVAATALGFREYAAHASAAERVDVVGVLAARCHGGRHERGVREALPDGLRYVGRVPPRDDLEIPDRHLGLHLGEEAPLPDEALDAAAAHVDADALVRLARRPPRVPDPEAGGADAAGDPAGATVAVARDDAFRFVYPTTLERLRERAEVVTFAPTAGDDLPDCDGVYLPGGYPERYAAALADAPALTTLRERAAAGLAVLGECGGLMVLAESLTPIADGPAAAAGETYEMAGVLPATVRMCERHQGLDHVELRAREDALTAGAGDRLRGHEFHYSRADPAEDARFAFDVERGGGITGDRDGLTEYRTLGTYAHVHAESGAFDRFIENL